MILHWQGTQPRLIDSSINLNLRKRNSIGVLFGVLQGRGRVRRCSTLIHRLPGVGLDLSSCSASRSWPLLGIFGLDRPT